MNTLRKKGVPYDKPETEGAFVNFAPNAELYENEVSMRHTTPAEDANQESEEYLLTHAFA